MAKLAKTFNDQLKGGVIISAGSPATSLLLFTEGTGLSTQDLHSGTVKSIGTGYQEPGGITATPDGARIFVADTDSVHHTFIIYECKFSAANQSDAKPILKGNGHPMQLALHDKILYYVDQLNRDFVAYDLTTKTSTVISTGFQLPVGLLVDDAGKYAYVSDSKLGQIIAFNLAAKTRKIIGNALRSPLYLSWADKTQKQILFTERALIGYVSTLNIATGTKQVILSSTAGGRPIAAWSLKDLLIVADIKRLLWYDLLNRAPLLPVTLTVENPKPFIGTFQRVQINFGTSGLTLSTVNIKVSDEIAGGTISFSKDDLSQPNEIMLLVGYKPGKYKISITDKVSNGLVGEVEYEITDVWTVPDKSPGHWMTGELIDFVTGYTWGGGPASPQNVDVIPQSGTRNICILTVDTNSAQYPTGAAFTTITNSWRNGAVGTTPDPDGKVRSAKAYYEEVSHNAFTLGLAGNQVLSIHLNSTWTDNFSMMPSPWPNNSFTPTNNVAFAQACISAAAALTDGGGNPLVDFRNVQTLIMVIRSEGNTSADNFFWPQAWGGSFSVPGGSANMRVLGMPDDWNPTRDSRTIYETLSHELGHNLGYPDLYTNANDLYTPAIQAKDITNFDLMSREGELPHMSVGQKMETGWVRPEWVRSFDFSRSTIPLDTTVVLQASELGTPPAGEFTAVEIRIADGWNYYFEYRQGQVSQIGDQQLANTAPNDANNAVVLGTDMISQSFTYPIARPQIMRLSKDAEGENSFFTVGQDYKETDTSSMAIADFRMSVVSMSGNTATIRIQYGTNGRPDLYIRPWPGGDNWQSPDIEVRNVRSMTDPAHWTNVPWVGHLNTIIARYRNRGPVTARNVKVDFYIKDFTVQGAPEVYLGSDTHDVPPETSSPFVEFSFGWIPPNDGHKCIIVRTPLYIDTSVNPNIVEVTDSNNSAQSNYTRYISASSSPAKREITQISLHNPFEQKADIYVVPQIRGMFAKYYRLYVESMSLKLDPGETQKVQLMIESMYGDPRYADVFKQYGDRFFSSDTRIGLIGYGIPPEAPAHPILLGGAQINVASGHATKFDQYDYYKQEDMLRGHVVTLDGSAIVTGQVLLSFYADTKETQTISVALNSGGFTVPRISTIMKRYRANRVTAHYPGWTGFGSCDAPNDVTM
ncbi:hypothetical protein ACE38W_05620 [Chitinophaga sp. Hz27]|uniref:hypothetical protein n=1 Tax=Chitinophaga sp. Hz27 TaxID=3347169 RepID=UPI0035D5BB6E